MSDEGKKIQEISSDLFSGVTSTLWEVQEATDEEPTYICSGNIKMHIMK